MSNNPMTPSEFREHVALLTVSELEAAASDEQVKTCLALGGEYEAIWREAVALHDALESVDVPAPRRNIAAGVMAAVAKEQQLQARPRAKVIDVLSVRVAVPAWAVAAALLVIIASLTMNFLGDRGDTPAVSGDPTPIVVHVPNGQQPQVVQAGNPGGSALPAMPSAGLIIILGAPPSTGSLYDAHNSINLENSI